MNIIRHAELINKLSSMMLTHLDVLNDVDTVKFALKYNLKDGSETQVFQKSLPAKLDDWEKMEPEYEEMPGWKQDLSQIDSFDRLPINAKNFVQRLEQVSKKQFRFVGVSDDKQEGILRIVR